MTGYCVKGNHKDCPDTKKDTYACSCPCHSGGLSLAEHLGTTTADAVADALRKAADEQT